MKKILITILATMSLSLTGCKLNSNRVDNNYYRGFKHVHIQLGDDKVIHDDVVEYSYNSEGGTVQLNTKNSGWVMLSGGYLLYNTDRCPLCNK